MLRKLIKKFHPQQITQSYDQYIEDEGIIIVNFDTLEKQSPQDTVENIVTDFWTKLKGTHYIFAGYTGNPMVTKTSFLSGEHFVGPRDTGNKFTNHFGIYDYCTLFIPYTIEYLAKGYWMDSPNAQFICKAFFCVVPPIVPIMWVLRNGFGLIAAAISSPVVWGVHMYEGLMNIQKTEREKIENSTPSVKQFKEQYSQYKITLGLKKKNSELQDVKVEEIVEPTEEQIKANKESAKKILQNLTQLSTTIPETVKQGEGLFYKGLSKLGKKLEKIKPAGKYSAEKIDGIFAPKVR